MPLLSVAGWSTGHFLEAGKGECDTVIFHERVGQAALWSTWQHVSARHWFRSGAGSLKGPGSVGELGHQFHTHLIFLQAYAKYSVCVCVCVCMWGAGAEHKINHWNQGSNSNSVSCRILRSLLNLTETCFSTL